MINAVLSCTALNMNSEYSQPHCSNFSIDRSTVIALGGSQQIVPPAETPHLQVPQWTSSVVEHHHPDNRYYIRSFVLIRAEALVYLLFLPVFDIHAYSLLVTELVRNFWDALQPTNRSQTISKGTWHTTWLMHLNLPMSWKKQSNQTLSSRSMWPGARVVVEPEVVVEAVADLELEADH